MAFLYACLRAGHRVWSGFALFYFALMVGGFALSGYASTEGFGFAVLFLSWFGAIGHTLAIRSQVNFRIAARSSAAFSYAREREVRREQARRFPPNTTRVERVSSASAVPTATDSPATSLT